MLLLPLQIKTTKTDANSWNVTFLQSKSPDVFLSGNIFTQDASRLEETSDPDFFFHLQKTTSVTWLEYKSIKLFFFFLNASYNVTVVVNLNRLFMDLDKPFGDVTHRFSSG